MLKDSNQIDVLNTLHYDINNNYQNAISNLNKISELQDNQAVRKILTWLNANKAIQDFDKTKNMLQTKHLVLNDKYIEPLNYSNCIDNYNELLQQILPNITSSYDKQAKALSELSEQAFSILASTFSELDIAPLSNSHKNYIKEFSAVTCYSSIALEDFINYIEQGVNNGSVNSIKSLNDCYASLEKSQVVNMFDSPNLKFQFAHSLFDLASCLSSVYTVQFYQLSMQGDVLKDEYTIGEKTSNLIASLYFNLISYQKNFNECSTIEKLNSEALSGAEKSLFTEFTQANNLMENSLIELMATTQTKINDKNILQEITKFLKSEILNLSDSFNNNLSQQDNLRKCVAEYSTDDLISLHCVYQCLYDSNPGFVGHGYIDYNSTDASYMLHIAHTVCDSLYQQHIDTIMSAE